MPGARRGAARKAIALSLLPALAGCYGYNPVFTAERPGTGQQVRVRYEDPAAPEPADPAAARRTIAVQGRVVDWNQDAAILAVPGSTAGSAMGMSRAYVPPDTLTIPVPAITMVETRDLSWPRTLAFGAAATFGGLLLAALLFDWVRRAPDPQPDPSEF